MDAQVLREIKSMLDSRRVLGLAVLVDGAPDASLLPYAVRPDYRALLIQASGLARHARGLQIGATVGVLIHEPESPDRDPMQTPRLTVQASVTIIERETEAWEAARAIFVGRFPGAEMTLSLGDFNLYELRLGRGRYVAGFAQALNVGPDTFAELATLPAQ